MGFFSPKNIKPKEIIVGPGAFSNQESVRFSVNSDRPDNLLEQDEQKLTTSQDSLAFDGITAQITSYSFQKGELKLILEYQNTL